VSGGEYVAAAYGVVVFALLIYVVVIGMKAARQARETELLAKLIEARADAEDDLVERSFEPADRR
jgi:hypothetical protein